MSIITKGLGSESGGGTGQIVSELDGIVMINMEVLGVIDDNELIGAVEEHTVSGMIVHEEIIGQIDERAIEGEVNGSS